MINLSNKILTENHINVLSRGPKFVPTPRGPDIMMLEKDIKVFVRLLKLKEHFHYFKYTEDDSLVRPKSDFVPNRIRSPVLQNVCDSFINTAENLETIVPYNKIDNLTYGERHALTDLKNDDSIVIKKADKGNVIVVLEKSFYKDKMLLVLNNDNLFKEHTKNIDSRMFLKVKRLASKFYSLNVLTLKERQYITNFNPTTANFYGVPKIHKSETIKEAVNSCSGPYVHIKTDDVKFRGITGCINSPTSRLSELVNILLKPFITKVPSDIKDTTDFLNKFPRFNKSELQDIILVTVDIKDMFPSIKKNLGLKAIVYFCNEYPVLLNKRFTIDFIIEALTIVLDNNLCHFDNRYFTQIDGTFTGTTVAPTYATLTMAYLEVLLMDKLNDIYSPGIVAYVAQNWKRFLDDGFIAWNRKFGDIKVFIDALNSLDDSIHFTYDVNEQQVSYLNVLIYKGSNSLLCDIFYKDTDTREYLPFSSCHVHHIKINIPYNLCRTICTIVEDRDIMYERLFDLKAHLIKSKYPANIINSAINKAASLEQSDLRINKEKETSELIVFVSTYNPKNPNISHFIYNAMSLLKSNIILKEIFGDVKLINSRREPPSLQDLLVRSSFTTDKPEFGVKKCHKKLCETCPLIYETDSYNFWEAQVDFDIRGSFDCSIKECIYVMTCQGCYKYYIGKTVDLRHRMTKHRNDIKDDRIRHQYVHRHIHFCGGGKFWVTPFYRVKVPGLV